MSSAPASANDAQPRRASAYVLDDEAQIGALVCKVLGACGLDARQFIAPGPFLAAIAVSPPDLIMLDLALGQSDAVEIIRHLEALAYKGRVLLISGRDEATLAEITRIGERHGLTMLPPLRKPFRPADIRQSLSAPGHLQPAAAKHAAEPDAPKGLVIQLTDALRNGWLEVWYQPKIDLKSLKFSGAEALVRARHPTLGIIKPSQMLPPPGHPAYEPLSEFVMQQAMGDWEHFAAQGLQLRLAVNVPVSVIHKPSFIPMVRALLPPDARFPGLTIEITEDEVIRDPNGAREIATQLKLYNVGISIDDFGSAYASLSRLNELPVSEVKIDRGLVAGCASDEHKFSLCQTVIDLAHRFGATACAEGVETPEDLRALLKMQCDTAQGYLFAKPMPAAKLATLLHTRPVSAMQILIEASSADPRLLAQAG